MTLRVPLLAALAAMACLRALAFEAGAAKQEITPALGTPLNGYGDRYGRPSLTVHDPLWARALYLDDGETKLFLVNTDLCMINAELHERVLALAPAEVPKEHIILTATHTHSAQGAMYKHLPLRFVAGRFSQEVLDATAKNIVAAMRAAYDARERAAIGFGTTTQKDLSRNRRVSGGPIDEQIGVIKVDDADGNPIAAVTNFAAHPTFVPDADHYVISADYPGVYYIEMERLTGEGCVALFLNGAEGNQGIGNPDNSDGWARLENVAKKLAEKAHTLHKTIDCSEMKLRLTYLQPELPPTLVGFQPKATILQALEIGDLALAFLPGEPVVEIGLELRKRALAQGFKAHFTVGLSNDYLNYFVTRELYPGKYSETGMNFFGPGIADWFYGHFDQMHARVAATPTTTLAEPPTRKDLGQGAAHVVLDGVPRTMGQQRGTLFAEELRAKYNERVHEPIESGKGLPKGGMWGLVPPFLNIATLAPAFSGISIRDRLLQVSPELYAEIEGMAEAAALPFDAVWLLQNARDFSLREDKTPLFSTPFCTMFAVTTDTGPLVGRTLDWEGAESPVITEYAPESGQRFVQVGFGWNAGVFTGMNAAGLVLCVERVERVEGQGEPDVISAPIELIVRDLLATKTTAAEAIAALRAVTGQQGHHVLVVGPGAEGFEANVIEFGKETVQRAPEEGVLLGVAPSNEAADDDTLVRHARVADLLATNPARSVEALQAVLIDSETDRAPKAQIWNTTTKHAVVFDPQRRALHVAFPREDGTPGTFQRVVLSSTPVEATP